MKIFGGVVRVVEAALIVAAIAPFLASGSTPPGGAAHPQSNTRDNAKVTRLLAAGRAAVALKNCPEALGHFQAALDAAEKTALSAERKGAVQQEALKHIADCQALANHLEAAEAALWRRKEIITQWRGAQDIEVAHNYLDLAYIQIRREAWARAERYARDALAIYDAALAVPPAGAAVRSAPGKGKTSPSQATARNVALNRSKVAALYILGLSLALQRRTDEAFKTWEEGYQLGEGVSVHHERSDVSQPKGSGMGNVKGEITTRPDPLMQIVLQAIELHDMAQIHVGRDVWVARLRKLRAAASTSK